MTRVSGAWMTEPPTQAVMAALVNAGWPAYFVGGCVRDALAGHDVGDIDIATPAPPDQVIAAAEAARLRAVPTGMDHGTITVVSDGLGHEVTTFRRDVETDGRHAVVAFSDRMEDDAARRDFTMNALYADADGTVFDPTGTGRADLAEGRVRFVGDARVRIAEDHLRILRYFRFLAWYGDPEVGPDPGALDAVAQGADGLAGLSVERVTHEVLRLLSAPDPAPALAAMSATGVLARVLPGAEPRCMAPLVHLEQVAGVPADPLRRLVALGAHGLETALRLSRAEARGVATLVRGVSAEAGPPELGYRLGETAGQDVLLLRAAMMEQPLAEDALERLARGARAEFPVQAADLMPAYRGAALGAKLAEIETRWVQSEFSLTRDDLLKD